MSANYRKAPCFSGGYWCVGIERCSVRSPDNPTSVYLWGRLCFDPNCQQEAEMATKIRPLQDRVIVKRVKEEEKTKGGIIIPDSAKEKPIEGEVIAVGNGKVQDDGKLRPLDIKAGDRVLFGKYAGTEVKLEEIGRAHV